MLALPSAPRRLLAAISAIAVVLLCAAGSASAATFTNGFPFAVPGGSGTKGDAFPYPSTINVQGLDPHVQKATVTLKGFAHQCSIDVDVLLVSPSGASSILTSDAGDCANEAPLRPGVDLTFDDNAANAVPCLDFNSTPTQLPGGTYAPTDYSPPANGVQSACNPSTDLDHRTPPPPGAPGPLADVFTGLTKPFGGWGHSLATFINTDPNGIWSLYVTDQYDHSIGKIAGGWVLNLTTSPVTVTPPPPPAPRQPNIAASLSTKGFKSKQKILKQKALLATFSSTVAGQLNATAQVKVGRKNYTFRSVSRQVQANTPTTVKLKLAKSGLTAVKNALANHKKLKAKISLTLTIPSGIMTKLDKTVTLAR
jgi:hypothetical protein